jgi:23S rRNA U2552 (ribose-2'-O)-methylase RlmE/FtsJ
MIVQKFVKKAIMFVAVTLLSSGVTSGGTFVLNKLQTEDNKKIQEEINQQFVDNDKTIIEMLKKMEKKIQFLENKSQR